MGAMEARILPLLLLVVAASSQFHSRPTHSLGKDFDSVSRIDVWEDTEKGTRSRGRGNVKQVAAGSVLPPLSHINRPFLSHDEMAFNKQG